MDRALAGRAGTAVVLDVDSRRILASYHPEVAARRLTRPGSAVKPFTLLALLASGSPPRSLICARKLQIGPRQMDCSHPPTPDPFDAVAALAYSCNYYFATLAAGLRSTDLVETFSRARGFLGMSGDARETEINGRTVHIVGRFTLGPDFMSNGTVMMSDHSFAGLLTGNPANATA